MDQDMPRSCFSWNSERRLSHPISLAPRLFHFNGATDLPGPPYIFTSAFNCDFRTGMSFFSIILSLYARTYVLPPLPIMFHMYDTVSNGEYCRLPSIGEGRSMISIATGPSASLLSPHSPSFLGPASVTSPPFFRFFFASPSQPPPSSSAASSAASDGLSTRLLFRFLAALAANSKKSGSVFSNIPPSVSRAYPRDDSSAALGSRSIALYVIVGLPTTDDDGDSPSPPPLRTACAA
mmetsp:Transcript_32524/g.78741  ORF Transcript_32524/g.78741 Transcript_32524/m.78741 type:complete len:236 (+) Transcript_32524:1233-1940(+)